MVRQSIETELKPAAVMSRSGAFFAPPVYHNQISNATTSETMQPRAARFIDPVLSVGEYGLKSLGTKYLRLVINLWRQNKLNLAIAWSLQRSTFHLACHFMTCRSIMSATRVFQSISRS